MSNWNRRQVSREEKEKWINGLAKIYSEQGYKVSGERVGSVGSPPNEIRDRIMKVTGLSKKTVNIFLFNEYKQEDKGGVKKGTAVISASERIEHTLGEDYVERHRKEVLEQETPKIKEQTK